MPFSFFLRKLDFLHDDKMKEKIYPPRRAHQKDKKIQDITSIMMTFHKHILPTSRLLVCVQGMNLLLLLLLLWLSLCILSTVPCSRKHFWLVILVTSLEKMCEKTFNSLHVHNIIVYLYSSKVSSLITNVILT